jgi:hypothetical protein
LKNKVLHRLFIYSFIVFATWSCERDDICAESTLTTPHLIIRFYDINAPEELKDVRNLSIRGYDTEGNELEDIVTNQSTDSLVLPLRFQNQGENTISRFILEKDTDFALDSDPLTESNIDIITVNYSPQFVYVSRACGYKSIFTNVSVNLETDGNNWIFGSEILTTTIENETQAHIILRH